MAFSVVEESRKRRQKLAQTGGNSLGSSPSSGSEFSVVRESMRRKGLFETQDSDYRSWNNDTYNLSKRLQNEWEARKDQFQDKNQFKAYQDGILQETGDLLRRAYASRDYYTQYGNQYSNKEQILSDINRSIDYLNAVRNDVTNEGFYWGQFENEDAYNNYKNMIAASETEDGQTEQKSGILEGFFPESGEDFVRRLGYDAERTAAGVLGFGENITDFLGTELYTGIEKLTSLGGVAPNSVSEWAGNAADKFVNNSVTDRYKQNIKERYNPSVNEEKWGNLNETGAQIAAALMSGKALGKAVGAGAKLLDAASNVARSANYGQAAFTLNAAGGGLNEAVQEGATREQGLAYGAASGAKEFLVERLFGGIPGLGRGAAGQLVERIVSNPVVSNVLDIVGEGGEEALSEFVTPYIKRAIYDKNAENATLDEIAESAIQGMLLSGVANLGLNLAVAGTAMTDRALPQNTVENPVEQVETPVTLEPIQQPAIAPVQRDAETDAVLSQIVAEWGRDGVREPALISEEIRKVQPDSSTRIQEAEARAVRSAYEAGLAGQSVSSIPKGASSAELDAYAAGREERVRRAGQETSNAKTAQTAQEPLSKQTNMDTAKPVERAGANTEALVRANTEQTFAKYGDKGTEAFNRIVEETGEDPEKVHMEFQSAYESGLSNRPQEQTALHSDVQQTAYDAGLRDRAASLKQEQTAAAARTFGKGGGLVQNDYSVKLDAKTADTLDRIGKATGAKIVMDDALIGSQSNGYYENGEIHISPDAQNPVMQVAKHELTHHLQEMAPTEYRAFRDYAVQLVSEGTWDIYGSNTATETMRERYLRSSDGTVDLTTETAMDEIAAHYAERILTNEDALNDFVNHVTRSEDQQTRSMGQKFFEAVRNFIDKMKRLFKGNQQKMDAAAQDEFGATIAQLERAEQLWKDAYRAAESKAQRAVESEQNTKNAAQKSGENVRYSINQSFASEYQRVEL